MTTFPSVSATVTDPTVQQVRHLVSIRDLTDGDLYSIVARGAAFAAGECGSPLAGQVAGVYFLKTSTRTRTAFTSAALRLGAGVIQYGPQDLQTNTGETSEDTGRVLSGMLDVLVARTAGDPAELRAWSAQNRMAVLNAMSAEEHPTQALTDLTTLLRQFGRIEGLRLLYLGRPTTRPPRSPWRSPGFRALNWNCAPRPVTACPPRSWPTPPGRPGSVGRASSSGATCPTCRAISTPSTPPAGRPPAP